METAACSKGAVPSTPKACNVATHLLAWCVPLAIQSRKERRIQTSKISTKVYSRSKFLSHKILCASELSECQNSLLQVPHNCVLFPPNRTCYRMTGINVYRLRQCDPKSQDRVLICVKTPENQGPVSKKRTKLTANWSRHAICIKIMLLVGTKHLSPCAAPK